jgi:hypothetical protein
MSTFRMSSRLQLWPCPTSIRQNTGMTAIASIYLPEGFALGADGRRMNDAGGIETDVAQKVFTFEKDSLKLAYAWCGLTEFQTTNGKRFDFKVATELILEQVGSIESFSAFVTQFTLILNALLRFHIGNIKVSVRTEVFFIGYFRGAPCQAEISWREHEFQVTSLNEPVLPNRVAFSGPKRVCEDHGQKQIVTDSISDAVDWVREFLTDSVNDPNSRDMGGHIHILKLTNEGFTWVLPPL